MRLARGDQGFTLVEMLVVLVIIGLIGTAVSYSFVQSSRVSNPRDIARQIASQARAAHLRALSSGQAADLNLDLSRRTVSIGDGDALMDIPSGTPVNIKAAGQLIDSGEIARIRFFPDGSNTGGEIAIGTPDNGYLLRIFWLTGATTLRRLP